MASADATWGLGHVRAGGQVAALGGVEQAAWHRRSLTGCLVRPIHAGIVAPHPRWRQTAGDRGAGGKPLLELTRDRTPS